jgi:hypothetical protein
MARPLEILVVVLLLLWLVGAFVVPTGGRMIHQLLILALGLIAMRVLLALGLLPRLGEIAQTRHGWDEETRLPM